MRGIKLSEVVSFWVTKKMGVSRLTLYVRGSEEPYVYTYGSTSSTMGGIAVSEDTIHKIVEELENKYELFIIE